MPGHGKKEGKVTRSLALVVAAAGALCGCTQQNPVRSAIQPKQPDQLTQDEWQRGKDCYAQAEHEFAAEGYKRGGIGGFKSHYNRRLQKCFVLFVSMDRGTPGEIWTTKLLFDGFDGQEYGSYLWRTDKSNKARGTTPIECHVVSPSGEKIICKSDEEFDGLVEAYMEWPKSASPPQVKTAK